MNSKIDMINKKIGKLVVISEYGKINKHIYYLCKCECGKEKIIRGSHLRSGRILSCGCYRKEITSRTGKVKSYKHGLSRTRLYKVFRDMKTRCYNSNSPDFKNYGAKGVKICKEWLDDFLVFQKWALENGYDENAPKGQCTIDRINFNGNYEPSNCRWITIAEQNKNKTYKKSKWDISILQKIADVKSLSRKEVAKKLGLKDTEVKYILKHYNTTLKKLIKE